MSRSAQKLGFAADSILWTRRARSRRAASAFWIAPDAGRVQLTVHGHQRPRSAVRTRQRVALRGEAALHTLRILAERPLRETPP